jgi:hypothetical protein
MGSAVCDIEIMIFIVLRFHLFSIVTPSFVR